MRIGSLCRFVVVLGWGDYASGDHIGLVAAAGGAGTDAGEATCRAKPLNTIQPLHILIAYKAPGKYRMEAGSPCLGPGAGDMGQAIVVFDGSLLWTYFPQENRYYSLPLSALDPDAGGDLSELGPGAVDRATMSAYRAAADSSADFIREETGCYVVKVTPKDHSPAQTWWIDKTNYHVVRVDDADSSVVFATIKLNEPLPDDLFKFTAPPGAKKIRPGQ